MTFKISSSGGDNFLLGFLWGLKDISLCNNQQYLMLVNQDGWQKRRNRSGWVTKVEAIFQSLMLHWEYIRISYLEDYTLIAIQVAFLFSSSFPLSSLLMRLPPLSYSPQHPSHQPRYSPLILKVQQVPNVWLVWKLFSKCNFFK